MVGNGIVDRTELSDKTTTNLLCMQCMQDQVAGITTAGPVNLDNARLLVVTENFGFACTLSVTCVHGKHHFTIEQPCIP